MRGPVAVRAETTADFSKGAGELMVIFLREEVKKTCFLIRAGPVDVCWRGDVHGEDAGQCHCPAEMLCKAERVKLLVLGSQADLSFQSKNAVL